MEPLLEFLAVWWWTAPTAVGLGAVGYTGLTTGRRRARRLALDAARHEEGTAARMLMAARARTRSAQAQALTAQAQRSSPSPGVPSVSEARRELQRARQEQKSAALELKASRTRVRAERARLHVATGDALPLAQLVREHDAVLSRWIEYETDVETALAFPQMTDARHPSTAAFLHAQRDAQWLRPAAPTARMSPADFVAYRNAVRDLERAFTAAEDDALRASARRGVASGPPTRVTAPRTARPRTDPGVPEAARERPILPEAAPPAPADAERPGAPAPRASVWPVPSRGTRPASSRQPRPPRA